MLVKSNKRNVLAFQSGDKEELASQPELVPAEQKITNTIHFAGWCIFMSVDTG